MKRRMIILIIGAHFIFFTIVFGKEARITRLKEKRAEVKTKLRSKDDSKLLTKLMENNKRINDLLKYRTALPIIWEQRAKIQTGKVFRGTLLNSINSTNLSSPVLVKIHPNQGLPNSTKFSCQGVTQIDRVLTLCNKMITPDKETVVSAQVLNIDGTSGLLGDFDDGTEDLIAGAIISDFSQGVLSAASSRINTPYGSVREDSVQNQIYQGLIQSGKTTSDVLIDEMKSKVPIVSIDSGLEVLIYFMEAINE